MTRMKTDAFIERLRARKMHDIEKRGNSASSTRGDPPIRSRVWANNPVELDNSWVTHRQLIPIPKPERAAGYRRPFRFTSIGY